MGERAVPRYPKECIVCELMKKDENYARGLAKLNEGGVEVSARLAQYALDIQKLRHAHEGERHE